LKRSVKQGDSHKRKIPAAQLLILDTAMHLTLYYFTTIETGVYVGSDRNSSVQFCDSQAVMADESAGDSGVHSR